jgi:hypothetical protein
MAVWRRRKRQVSDSSGPGVGAKKDRLRGPARGRHRQDLPLGVGRLGGPVLLEGQKGS